MKERKKPVMSETEEYIPLKYVGCRCPNCGRIRVEVWSNGWHICEKCNWCIETQTYVDMMDHNMRVQADRYSDEIWRAMNGNDDLISRSALLRDMGLENAVKHGNQTAEQMRNSYSTLMKYKIANYIQDAPAINAVEVVQCRECKHWSGRKDKPGEVTAIGYCDHPKHRIMPLNANWFCADGAKMNGGA